VGASPGAIAQTRRLHFAKLLLSDTAMQITDIALASGYGSVRRFNDAFKASYKRAPSEIRRRPPPLGGASNRITLRLSYRPLFDWTETLAFLARECVPGVERIAAGVYARALAGANGPVLVEIAACPASHALLMHVRGGSAADLSDLATTARRVFDLAADPLQIASAFRDDALLGPLVAARPGLRLIGVWSRFEAIVRAILDDDRGGEAFRGLAGRLAERFGARIESQETGLTRLFPGAQELARADLEACGLDRARSETLRAVARALAEGTLHLDNAAETVMHDLALIPGFGESRAQWVGLRGYGEPDAFPADALDPRRFSMTASGDAPSPETRPEAWRPWRGYAVFHLLRAATEPAASNIPRLGGPRFFGRRPHGSEAVEKVGRVAS
jgi:AraC family transcriptional regulator of adaptative response / DNA-3-methyladenine glycosylase II